jgi:hypothetical protein
MRTWWKTPLKQLVRRCFWLLFRVKFGGLWHCREKTIVNIFNTDKNIFGLDAEQHRKVRQMLAFYPFLKIVQINVISSDNIHTLYINFGRCLTLFSRMKLIKTKKSYLVLTTWLGQTKWITKTRLYI